MKLWGSLLLFIFLLLLLWIVHLYDLPLLTAINVNRNHLFDNFFRFITNTAPTATYTITFLLFFVGIFQKDKLWRQHAIYILLCVLTSLVIEMILKYSINRVRPYYTYSFIQKITPGGGPSFPSGHTTDVFSLAIALSIAYRNKFLTICVFLWACLTGYSRMFLGVHYPSDVFGGIVVAYVSCTLYYWVYLKRSANNPELYGNNNSAEPGT
ncbi:MAG: phosphatase PAP2 family protein [Ginsengibacter sp.]